MNYKEYKEHKRREYGIEKVIWGPDTTQTAMLSPGKYLARYRRDNGPGSVFWICSQYFLYRYELFELVLGDTD